MTLVASPVASVSVFPGLAVEARLRAELINVVMKEAPIKGITLPSNPDDVAAAGVAIDSLVVVCILCSVEPIVGFELPETFVRAGGYPSVASALTHLMTNIEKQWVKHKGATS